MIALAVLTTSPVAALAIGVLFGFTRGLAVILARRIRTPESLRAFHRRFDALGPVTCRAMIAVEIGVAGVAALVAWGVAVAGGIGLIVVVMTVIAFATGRRPTDHEGVGTTLRPPLAHTVDRLPTS